MKHPFFIIAFLAVALMTLAMNPKLEHINAIKKDNTYLYSDVTMPTLNGATAQAYSQLQREIVSWASVEGLTEVDSLIAVCLINLADTIMTRRADMYRVFAYVSKTALSRHLQGEEQPFSEVEVVTDSLQQREAVVRDTIVGDNVRQLLINSFQGANGNVLEQIKRARTFFELRRIMEPLKENGDIIEYGKYATAEKPEECYLIVYDTAGNIRALLGKGTDSRWNLLTNKNDSTANYRGCGAIWFILKN